MTKRKSIRAFDWCQNQRSWMILKGHCALCFKTRASFGAQTKIWMKIYYIISDDDVAQWFWQYKVYADILAGVPWKGGVIQQWRNRKRVFSSFRTLRIRHLRKWGQYYYIVLFSPFCLSTDPKIRDLEWLWMAWKAILRYMFTITKCLWLIICYLFTACSLFITRVTNACDKRRSAGSGVANSDPQTICTAENLRIFRVRCIVGTLTN